MTSLYNGYTPPIPHRAEAKALLRQVEEKMPTDEYVRWYFEEINPLQSWQEVIDHALEMLNDDTCDCNPRHCTCKPVTTNDGFSD
jgi:hypothetical protein